MTRTMAMDMVYGNAGKFGHQYEGFPARTWSYNHGRTDATLRDYGNNLGMRAEQQTIRLAAY